MCLQYFPSHARRQFFSREEDEVEKAYTKKTSLASRSYSVRVSSPGSSRFKIKKNLPPPSYTDSRRHYGDDFDTTRRGGDWVKDRNRPLLSSNVLRSRRVHPEPLQLYVCRDEKQQHLPVKKRKYDITNSSFCRNIIPSNKKSRYGHKDSIITKSPSTFIGRAAEQTSYYSTPSYLPDYAKRSPKEGDDTSNSSLDTTSTITTDREPSSDLMSLLPNSWLVTSKRRQKTYGNSSSSKIKEAKSDRHVQRENFMKRAAQEASSAKPNRNFKGMVTEEERVRSKTKSSKCTTSKSNPTHHAFSGLKPQQHALTNSAVTEEKQVNGQKVVHNRCNKSLLIGQALEEHERRRQVMPSVVAAPIDINSSFQTKPIQTGRKMLDIDLNELPPMEEDE